MPSDYFVVGNDTVIQYDRISGDKIHLTINAPKEVPIVRGKVLEREGGQRPACVMDVSPHYVKQLPWNHVKKQALAEMRQILDGMDDSPDTKAIKKRLDCIFPKSSDEAREEA